jgi:Fe-S cluster assembly protein SufD
VIDVVMQSHPFIDSALTRSRQLDSRLPLIVAERRSSIAEIAREGIPSGKLETWKYTPIQTFFAAPFGNMEIPTSSPACAHFSFEGALPITVGDEPSPAIERTGISVETLSSPLNADVDLGRYPLALLNTALLEDGLVIRVAPGVDAGVLDLRFTGGASAAAVSRVRVELGAGSRLRLIEQRNEDRPTNSVVDVRMEPSAFLQHTRILPPTTAPCWYLVSVHVGAQATYELTGLSMGSATRRNDIHVRLEGHHASTNIDLACAAHRRDRLDHQTVIEHIGVDTVSRQLIHGIAAGSSELTFNGRIHIHPNAQRSDAKLTNKNLLLDKKARVNTKPELEIYANDVKCSHGATVGQIDPTQVFYLRTRGLDEAAARAMLTRAFLAGRMAPWLLDAGVLDIYAELFA